MNDQSTIGLPSTVKRKGNLSIKPATSQFLDLSRWLAAFLVVFSHIRSLVFANFSDVTGHPSLAVKALYVIAGFGHQAVVVFFVISGFLVGGRAFFKAVDNDFSLLDYALHRFVRIYTVLVPALLIGYCIDLLGDKLVDNYALYSNRSAFHWWMVDYAISDRLDIRTLLGNLALLQTILVNPLGSNGPLWSLANEWWYYVAFGLVMAAFTRPTLARKLLCLVGLTSMVALLPPALVLWAAIWLLGFAAALLDRHWSGWRAPIAPAMFMGVVLAERCVPPPAGIWSAFMLDFVLGIAFSVALCSAKRGRKWWSMRLHSRLASFSYTTYLVHAPALTFLVALSHRLFGYGIGEQPTLRSAALMIILIVILYGYSWSLYCAFERKTDLLRKRLRQMVSFLLGGPKQLDLGL